MSDFEKYIAINKQAWDTRTSIHVNSKFYDHRNFKNGECSLKNIELSALGNIKNKTLLHLQCHFGQDSMSLARLGAKVTAVDFSNFAINEAKKTSKEINVPVNFIESDVLKLNINEKFNLVFSSYGVIGWLPDLNTWGKIISNHLKKNGEFILTEFHPFCQMIQEDGYDYFYNKKPDIQIKYGSYTDGGENVKTKTCWWNHSLTDLFKALESNGLKLTSFEEFDFCPFPLKGMIKKEKNKFVLKNRFDKSTPYIFNLRAIKK
tara:strand:- start:61 stop:846 length:786 start_codon:yes stop_codon:yes gene_type:complete